MFALAETRFVSSAGANAASSFSPSGEKEASCQAAAPTPLDKARRVDVLLELSSFAKAANVLEESDTLDVKMCPR